MAAQCTQHDKNDKEAIVPCENRQNIIHLNVTPQKKQHKPLPAEGPIEKLIREKGKDAAIKALYSGIIAYAGREEFAKAERLRSKLVEIAPQALTEMAKADEIIDQKKIAAMDLEKISPWKALFSDFTKSESIALYYSIKDVIVKANQPVFEQGICDNRLYFVLSGRLKLSYFDKEKRKKINFAILEKGDIAGAETFFSCSIHTTTLIAAEESKIRYLDKDAFQKIVAGNPTIESKLFAYCEKQKQRCPSENQPGRERRAHKRHQTTLSGQFQRLDKKGEPLKEIIKMTVADISAGGLCCKTEDLKIGDPDALNKSDIIITASYNRGMDLQNFQKLASIVSVQLHPLGECTVHVQFKEPLDERKVFEIAQYTDVTAFV